MAISSDFVLLLFWVGGLGRKPGVCFGIIGGYV